ncbi:hypothetical protein Sar04_38900 [Salinispora arenicola]|uniref:Polymorphic outer membrane protein n=1 Tax=Salinispora arenicola TaxID=168697 RepID=A0A542XNX5_SALAC|nr:hypothetical protein FB564_2726 [Salinispora arenicola]GIM87154.1 hypothetical protein Sar04_38900 [Salinispora arenicola]
MNQQDHIQEPEPGHPGHGHRARSRRRWWAIGLAGVTGLALTTIGLATAPTADAVGRTLAADGRLEKPGQSHGGDHRDDNRGGHDDRSRKKLKGIPVPCDADKLIAAITLANARGGTVLDLAKKCTYLLTADIDDSNGLPTITAPITLNGGTHTTITRAAGVDQFRIVTVGTGGDLTLNHLKSPADRPTATAEQSWSTPAEHSTSTTAPSPATSPAETAAASPTTAPPGSKTPPSAENTSGTNGGGIWSTGLLTVTASHITANVSGASGGGIHSTQGTLLVDHSRITANHSQTSAGGLELFGGAGTVTKTQVTGNTAPAVGGVLANSGDRGRDSFDHLDLHPSTRAHRTVLVVANMPLTPVVAVHPRRRARPKGPTTGGPRGTIP